MSEHVIRVNEATAERLARRADELGVSVSDLGAMLAADETTPARIAQDELAELDRRLQTALTPGGTVSHNEVVAWLETWGEASHKPRRAADRRTIP